ncbi:hypothetical protein OHA98_30805 [Streptomyces sp. NBC_00654]|uniref:hypothetical protein n=1 Tax=Streptomyces sp. NBC_00654 TaxID=2975799 RepID=UPI00224D0132|nr:hypothetical protein [Streptomyces sp. NBC_00654]MCX4969080.1 hypothetical protein [Streptomyces sp. NBC_00654]
MAAEAEHVGPVAEFAVGVGVVEVESGFDQPPGVVDAGGEVDVEAGAVVAHGGPASTREQILTVTFESEMGDRKIHSPRIKAAYDAAVAAAVEAAKGELLEGSLSTVLSRTTFDYRWAGASAEYAEMDVDWEEGDATESS